jgi:hypothetical protein
MEELTAQISNVRRGTKTAAPPAVKDNANGTKTVIDSTGRVLTIGDLTLMQEQDLIAAMPITHVNNALTLGRALMAARISQIDGEAVGPVISERTYRAMLKEVGREGLAAVMAAEAPEPDAEERDEKELAKN